MKKFKYVPIFITLISILLVLSYFAVANSADPQVQSPPATATIQPDLIITCLGGAACPNCQCGRTNLGNHPLVEYLENIKVVIKNQGRAASAPCKLKIELYDNVGCKSVTITKDVPGLNPGQETTIVEIGEFLFRKSTGIKATVDSTGLVAESNELNNSKTIQECIVCQTPLI